MVFERWASTNTPASAGDEADRCLDSTQGQAALITGALLCLVFEKPFWAIGRDGELLPSGGGLLHRLFVSVEQGRCYGTWRATTADVQMLAALFWSVCPPCCERLLTWTMSDRPQLYTLALRLHSSLPVVCGGHRAVAWAQLLLESLCGEGDALSRSHCQVASCISACLACCPADHVASWVHSALAPLLWADSTEGPPPKALWALARRLAVSLPSSSAPNGSSPLQLVAERLLDLVKAAEKRKDQRHELRACSAMLRHMNLDSAALASVAERARDMLREPLLSGGTRAQAWALHAEACLRLGSAAELRIAMRYAVRHLSDRDASGALVADVLARAPGPLLDGTAAIVEGLAGHRWPLRTAGLAAAAATAVRAAAPDQVQHVASSAVDGFCEEHGHRAGGWLPWDPLQAMYTKRRRLLVELRDLPAAVEQEACDDIASRRDFASLCLAVRSRLDEWGRCYSACEA